MGAISLINLFSFLACLTVFEAVRNRGAPPENWERDKIIEHVEAVAKHYTSVISTAHNTILQIQPENINSEALLRAHSLHGYDHFNHFQVLPYKPHLGVNSQQFIADLSRTSRSWSFQSEQKLKKIKDDGENRIVKLRAQAVAKIQNPHYDEVDSYVKFYDGICVHVRTIIIQLMQIRLAASVEHYMNFSKPPYMDMIPGDAETIDSTELCNQSRTLQLTNLAHQYAHQCIASVSTVVKAIAHSTSVLPNISSKIRDEGIHAASSAVDTANSNYCQSLSTTEKTTDKLRFYLEYCYRLYQDAISGALQTLLTHMFIIDYGISKSAAFLNAFIVAKWITGHSPVESNVDEEAMKNEFSEAHHELLLNLKSFEIGPQLDKWWEICTDTVYDMHGVVIVDYFNFNDDEDPEPLCFLLISMLFTASTNDPITFWPVFPELAARSPKKARFKEVQLGQPIFVKDNFGRAAKGRPRGSTASGSGSNESNKVKGFKHATPSSFGGQP